MRVLLLIMIASSLNLTEEEDMKKITFRYRDSYSNWEWRTQHCIVPSVEECIKIYGLEDSSVDYEILEIEDC